MPERARTLLDDFNAYRSQTENYSRLRQLHPMRSLGAEKGLPALQAMDAWCRERGIDSRRWLYWLFARTRFRFAPKLTNLIPARKTPKLQAKAEAKALAAYNALRGTPQLTERVFRELEIKRAHAGQSYDPNRDLSHIAEAVKRRYLAEGNPDKCLSDMFANRPDTVPTWGYHPKSLSCVRCPLAQQCVAQLRAAVSSFDIVALRLGQMTLQQAQVMDGRAYHGR